MGVFNWFQKQDAVYWGPPVEDGDGGQTYPDPVEIRCRWTDVDGEVADPRTHDVLNDSTIMTTTNLVVDGYLYLGALSDVDGLDPPTVDAAKRIKGVKRVKNIPANQTLIIATV